MPKWFDVSNYQTEHISAEKLLEQIIYRKALFEYLTNQETLFPINVEPSEEFFSFSFYFGSVPYINVKNKLVIRKKTINENSSHFSKLLNIFEYAFNKIKFDPLIKNGFGEIKHEYEFSWLYYLQGFISDYLEHDYAPIKDIQLYEIGEKFTMLPNGLSKYFLSEFGEEFTERVLVEKYKQYLENGDLLFANYEYSDQEDDLYEMGRKYVESLSAYDLQELEFASGKSFLNYERELKELDHPLGIKPLISIDLTCNDEVIREQFNQWLIKQRASLHEAEKEFGVIVEIDKIKNRQSKADKIHSYKVLAYMDLMLWSVLTNSKIKMSVLAHALFPYGDYDVEFVRKTLKPLVEKLLIPSSNEVLELMYLRNMENF